MNDRQHYLELLHAELDGELSEAGRAELDRVLGDSAEASACREDLQRLAAILGSAPMQTPPAGLRQRILDAIRLPAALPMSAAIQAGIGDRQTRAGSDTTPAPTFSLRQRIWTRTRGKSGYSDNQRSRAMSNTTGNKKVLVLGLAAGILAVAGTVAYMGDRLPFGNKEMAAGTIAPAQRYQSVQIASGDVKLGDQTTAQFMQTDVFKRMTSDPAFAAALQSDAYRNVMSNDAFREALKSDAFRAALKSDAFRDALRNEAFREALKNDAFRDALKSDAFRDAMKNEAFRSALKSDAFRDALKNDAFRDAMKNDAFRDALKNDAFRSALASDAFRDALKNDAFRAALKNDA